MRKQMTNDRKSIKEWLGNGKPVKDYGIVQKRFLTLSLDDYCCYLEGLYRNGYGQKLYKEIQKETEAESNTDMNHVLRMLYNVLYCNAGDHPDSSMEAKRYDWAIKTIYDLMVVPFSHQPGSICVSKGWIMEKVARFQKEQQSKEKREEE